MRFRMWQCEAITGRVALLVRVCWVLLPGSFWGHKAHKDMLLFVLSYHRKDPRSDRSSHFHQHIEAQHAVSCPSLSPWPCGPLFHCWSFCEILAAEKFDIFYHWLNFATCFWLPFDWLVFATEGASRLSLWETCPMLLTAITAAMAHPFRL